MRSHFPSLSWRGVIKKLSLAFGRGTTWALANIGLATRKLKIRPEGEIGLIGNGPFIRRG